jgi:hypothetical protein
MKCNELNETVELIVFGKEYIPFADFYHSITDLLPASPLFPPFRKPAFRFSTLASALRQYPLAVRHKLVIHKTILKLLPGS